MASGRPRTTCREGLVISPDGRDGSATIHQDADIYRIRLAPGQSVTHGLLRDAAPGCIADGALTLNGNPLTTGDAASTEESGTLTIVATDDAEALLFDLT